MENLKHTKGEWEIDPDDNYSITAKQAPDDGGDIICMAPLEWEDSMKRWEANAKLIAAAPELLEALNNLVNKFGSVKQVKELGIENELIDAINAINKAIK